MQRQPDHSTVDMVHSSEAHDVKYALTHSANKTMNNSTFRNMSQSVKFDENLLEDIQVEMQSQQQHQQTESFALAQERISELEAVAAKLLSHITNSTFKAKYGLDFSAPQLIHSYLFTRQPRKYTFIFEAFASVSSISADLMQRKKEEMVFHQMFEGLIERYTRTCVKPNPILLETRNSEFCYRLTIVTEAVPTSVQSTLGFNRSSLRLMREYEILKYVWEKYYAEIQAKSCSTDQLVGIPMPFEFVNVSGTEFDFEYVPTAIYYFDIRGSYVPVQSTRVPGTERPLASFLSYMSMEKLGPSLSYLGDLLRSQKKWFTVSTALKILDQILCRLMVLHRYGIILGNLDLKFLNFGVREALNVLYVNNYDCAVVAPHTNKPLQNYNERYVSTGVLKGSSHFVNDIESAFYIFMALLVPRLPWDEKDSTAELRDGSWSPGEKTRNLKLHMDERQKLWDNASYLDRILHSCSINTETTSPVLEGFAFDVINMVYLKTKEAVSACANVSHQQFITNALTGSSASYNTYINIRKVIVSYFRFENLSTSLRDATCQNKIERLLAEEPTDIRPLWDLNDWCWNVFETTFLNNRRTSSKSVRIG